MYDSSDIDEWTGEEDGVDGLRAATSRADSAIGRD
jgi:hypothetical protein